MPFLITPTPSALSSLTSSRRSTLPVALVGSSVRKMTVRGARPAQSAAHEAAQILHVGFGTPCGHDDGDGNLAPLRVIGADDGAVAHMRVFDEDVLDLGGGDVLPAADDRVVGAAADEQVAVGVEVGHVAGGKPAVGVEDRSDAGVAARDLLAADEQLAGLVRAEDGAVLAADLNLDGRHGRPTEPRRHSTAGSSEVSATRWSSGVSTAIVELVSVRP